MYSDDYNKPYSQKVAVKCIVMTKTNHTVKSLLLNV